MSSSVSLCVVRKFFYSIFFISIHLTGCVNNDDGVIAQGDERQNNELSKLILSINRNCKYVLTGWWNEPKDISFQRSSLLYYEPLTPEEQDEVNKSLESFKHWYNEKYLFLPNWQKNIHSENAILPSCYACRILSSALYYNIYDSEMTGVSKEEAIQKTIILISSIVKYHCSNCENGWGNCWQGALWAEMLGMSAFLMKDYLSYDVWTMICNMIRSESNYVIKEAGVTYYKDREGNIMPGRRGDSQSETDAWNATILALAITALPDNPDITVWKKMFVVFNLAAMACPSDVVSKAVIDGYTLSDLSGSNINEDGTVTNHDKWHIDYMTSPIESLAESSIVLSFLHRKEKFESLRFNVSKIFEALVELDLGEYDANKAGHHFYERNEFGEVSSVTNMPEENDWGNKRQANYYLVDTYVSSIEADINLVNNLKADKWAQCRLQRIIEMMERDDSGKIYQEGEENFASGQLYAMACLTQVYSLLMGDFI